jgi:uncharacterized cupredoxin-like copper-binding protein
MVHSRTTSDHLEFVPSEVAVTLGETVLFVLPNIGISLTHEFQVGPADRVALDATERVREVFNVKWLDLVGSTTIWPSACSARTRLPARSPATTRPA